MCHTSANNPQGMKHKSLYTCVTNSTNTMNHIMREQGTTCEVSQFIFRFARTVRRDPGLVLHPESWTRQCLSQEVGQLGCLQRLRKDNLKIFSFSHETSNHIELSPLYNRLGPCTNVNIKRKLMHLEILFCFPLVVFSRTVLSMALFKPLLH